MERCTSENCLCRLGTDAKNPCIKGRGNKHSPTYMVIGEAPGKTEDRRGKVWCGPAGEKLEVLLGEAGIDLADVFFSNVVRCIPWNVGKAKVVKPPKPSVAACHVFLEEEIERVNPSILILAGDTATQALGIKGKITKICGKYLDLAITVPGEKDKKEYKAVPIVHPAATLHVAGKYEGDIVSALVRARQLADSLETGESLSTHALFDQGDYRLLDTISKIDEFCNWMIDAYQKGEFTFASCDIETTSTDVYDKDTKLLLLALSWAEGQSVCIPYAHVDSPFHRDKPSQAAVRSCLQRVFDVIPMSGQNFKFDVTGLKLLAGLDVKHIYFDTFLAVWHFKNDTEVGSYNLEDLATRYTPLSNHKQDMMWALQDAQARIDAAYIISDPDSPRKKLKLPEWKEADYGDAPFDILWPYCCLDADATQRLTVIFYQELAKQGLLESFYALAMSTFKMVCACEMNGAHVDKTVLEREVVNYKESLDDVYKFMDQNGYKDKHIAAFGESHGDTLNLRSHPQLRRFIHGVVGLDTQPQFMTGGSSKDEIKDFEVYGASSNQQVVDSIVVKFQINDVLMQGELRVIMESDLFDLDLFDRVGVLYEERYLSEPGGYGPAFGGVNYITGEVWLHMLVPDGVASDYALELMKSCRIGVSYRSPATDKFAWSFHRNYLKDNRVHWPMYDKWFADSLEVVNEIIEFRSKAHMYSHFIRKMPDMVHDDNCIHASFGIRTTKTGRHNSWIHTIPKRSDPKLAFVSRWGNTVHEGPAPESKGIIYQADESQMELRIMAALSGDPRMRDAFVKGEDIHRMIAAVVFNKPPKSVTDAERSSCKSIVFGLIYGRGDQAVADQVGCTKAEAEQIRHTLLDRFPQIAQYVASMKYFVQEHGCVYSPLGHRRLLPDIWNEDSDPQKRREKIASAERKAVNTPIQSGASDITITGIARTYDRFKAESLNTLIFNYVHDSTIDDLYPNEFFVVHRIVLDELQYAPAELYKSWLTVPLVVDAEIGHSWKQLCKVERVDFDDKIIQVLGLEDDVTALCGDLDTWESFKGVVASDKIEKDGSLFTQAIMSFN